MQVDAVSQGAAALSVIVPSCNMEAYLPRCLGSLAIDDRELLRKLDVIVVNDGSRDRTGEIAHEFAAKHPGVFRVIDKANGHYGSCVNAALPAARGVFVKILDADDCVEADGFRKLLLAVDEECANGDSDIDLIVSDYSTVKPDGRETARTRYWETARVSTLEDLPACRLTVHSICYRTEILRRLGYRQSEGVPYTDTEWITEPMVAVRRFRYLQLVVTRYSVGRNGQTMDPAVLSGNFQVILDLTKKLVGRYEDNRRRCRTESLEYYRRQVCFMVELSYIWGLCGYEGCRMQCDMADFDRHIRRFPEFYDEAENACFGPSRFPFKAVAAWRAHGCSFYWRFQVGIRRLLLNMAKVVRYSYWRGRFDREA